MRVIRKAECRTVPWKNGGGTATDIIASPEGAGFDAFDWRLSGAHVGRDGPFSLFPGTDRIMAILSGQGLNLHGLQDFAVTLERGIAPFAFPGDVAVSATVPDGPIDNLNLMLQRDRFSGTMRDLAVSDESWLSPPEGGWTLVYLCEGTLGAQSEDEQLVLQAGDTLLSQVPLMLHTSQPRRVIISEIRPRKRG
jgi:uncharacterized protein